MQVILRFLYLLSLVFWIGSIFFFSTSAAPSIFKVLPKQLAGDLVTDIFPKYYLIGYVCGVVAIVTSLLSWLTGSHSSTASYLLRVIILVIMLGLAIFAGAVIRPQALEIRTEMRSLVEDSPRYSELQNRFNALHKTSVLLNSVVFLLGIAIVLITAYNYKE
jgi:H+/Cl- antiporter ClcA